MNYHNRPELSATMLKSMATGWRVFEAEHVTRTAPKRESPAMALGSAIHAAILEPERFAEVYRVIPDECSDRRTKLYKEWAAANLNEGTICLSPADAETVRQVAERVKADEMAKAIFKSGQAETEHFWQSLDVDCRAKLDWLSGQVVADIKTCQDATEAAFAKDIAARRYDLQAAHYLSIGVASRFVFIACETASPYRVRCYELCDRDLERAIYDRESLIEEYRRRRDTNDWSEAGENELRTITLPNWRG